VTQPPLAVTSLAAVVGAVLSAWRKEAKLSQKELADALNLNVSTWSRIENGESGLTIEQLFAAANRLGVAPSSLIELVEAKVKEVEKRPGVAVAATRAEAESLLAGGAFPVAALALLGPVGLVAGVLAYAAKRPKE